MMIDEDVKLNLNLVMPFKLGVSRQSMTKLTWHGIPLDRFAWSEEGNRHLQGSHPNLHHPKAHISAPFARWSRPRQRPINTQSPSSNWWPGQLFYQVSHLASCHVL
jgi:hypothetical protein